MVWRTTCAVVLSVIEDLYIRAFDRRWGVCTSGYILFHKPRWNRVKRKRDTATGPSTPGRLGVSFGSWRWQRTSFG